MEDSDALLESLSLLKAPPRVGLSGSTNQQQIARVRYTHKDMADTILANPAISQNELAERYGYRKHTVSLIINSDAFQVYLASRRQELIDPVLVATIEDRMRGVTAQALDVLAEKLDQPAHMVSDELALRAAQMGSKALGMGMVAPPPAAPPVDLNDLAGRLRSLVRREVSNSQGVVDVQAREVAAGG